MYVRARVGTNAFIEQADAANRLYLVPCPQGDPLMDNLTVRKFLRELDSLSSITPVKEARGYVFRDTLTGKYNYVIHWPNPSNACNESYFTLGFPANSKPVLSGHSHPYTLGDVTCKGGKYFTGISGRIPSDDDWLSAYDSDVPGLIIDKTQVVRYLVPPSLDTISVNNPLGSPNPRRLIGPSKHLINSLVNTKSRAGQCVFP